MQIFYQSLSEKERRRYAAIEALKIGYGGISYIERLFGTNCRTIKRGIEELKSPESMNQRRIRAKGGGRKRKLDTIKGLEPAFLRVNEQFENINRLIDDYQKTGNRVMSIDTKKKKS